MANEIKIQKTVFNKEQFGKAVDNSFKTFVQPVEAEDVLTIAEFFEQYRKLYYEISVEGDD